MAGRDNNSTATTREHLSSNALNYMVWRYLQEAGFAMAATWLGREWHQAPDEDMPFAKYVKQYQLIHMVQDALFLDDVKSRGIRENHSYYFGDDPGPDYAAPTYDIAGERKPEDIPPRRFAEHRGINGTSEDNETQRKRRKQTNAHKRTNGDLMEIDDNGYDNSELASEVDSPAPAVQEVGPLLDTLTIGESRLVSTEKPIDVASTSTKLPWPDKCLISKGVWSPFATEPLLIGGTNTLRLFGLKSDHTLEPKSLEITISTNEYEVGAICWTDQTDAVIAVTETLEGDDPNASVGKLIHVTGYGQNELNTFSSMAGAVFALRYNVDSKYLLSLSGGEATTISIYKLDDLQFVLHAAMDLQQFKLFDAVWMNETKFIACGTGILQIFEVTASSISLIQTQEMKHSWFQIKYDQASSIAVFVDEDHTALRQYDVGSEDTKTHLFKGTHITDFEFQPLPHRTSYDSSLPRLLATSTEDGGVQLWDANQPFTCVQRLQVLGVRDGYLKQLAFSPNGTLLAAAGFDTVAIWELEDYEGVIKAMWRCTDDSTWHSRPKPDEEGWEWGHDLQWDCGGKKLAFTLKDQVSFQHNAPFSRIKRLTNLDRPL
jgi:transducin (beta)-like 1